MTAATTINWDSITDALNDIGIQLVRTAGTLDRGDAWTKEVNRRGTDQLAHIHLTNGGWFKGKPEYRSAVPGTWEPATHLVVSYPDTEAAQWIVRVLEGHGLTVTWDGDQYRAIVIEL
jgi:hypothetical protein